MFRRSLAVAAAAAALACASQSSAAVLVVQQSGLLTGVDPKNYLGLGFGDFVDVPYSVNFVFDLDHAHIEDQVAFGGLVVTNVAMGGYNNGGPTLATIDIQIGTYTYTMVADAQAEALQGTRGDVQQSFFDSKGATLVVGASKDFAPLPTDVTAPPAGNICETRSCTISFSLDGLFGGGSNKVSSYTVTYDAEGTYTPPGVPGAVPEPASWALMIAGFGLAGASLRRRRLLA